MSKILSELRFDITTGDWVVIAPQRAKRPQDFAKKVSIQKQSSKDCSFCQPGIKTPKPILETKNVVVIPNLYPAFAQNGGLNKRRVGPTIAMQGVGFHEIIIFRDHNKFFPQMYIQEVKEIIDVYQKRYLDLKPKSLLNYISIFHNHGPDAGASIYHPHSQLIAIPILDPEIRKSLDQNQKYFKKNKRCPHCDLIKFELKEKERILFENDDFVAICPFASKISFEIKIYPKKHLSYFEEIDEKNKVSFAEILQKSLYSIYKGLNNPSYNFFLNTSPCDNKDYNFYHWHLNILPRTQIYAGFEFSTGIEISTIDPKEAASYLRKQFNN
ncbi:MAG: galactose-1-phosphate uridylyltransferase [Candidatus Pacebacteria bacterium]|nr:galactose-1-phosphate uridylyltransferase [Candidatus Paceibacterota bacterium]